MRRSVPDELALPNRKKGRTEILYGLDVALPTHRGAEVEIRPVTVDGIVGIDTEDALTFGAIRIAVAPRLDDEVAAEAVQIDAQVIGMFVGTAMITCCHHHLGRLIERARWRCPVFAHEAVLVADPFRRDRWTCPFLPLGEGEDELGEILDMRNDRGVPSDTGRVSKGRECPVRFDHIRQLLRHLFDPCHARRE